MFERIDDRQSTTVVTGASGAVGSAISQVLAARGGRLVLCGRNPERLEDVAQRASKAGGQVSTYVADLTRTEGVTGLREHVRARSHRVDVLIHSMGVFAALEIERVSLAEFDRMFEANVRAPFAVCHALLPLMRGHFAQMVFLNSGVDLPVGGRVGVYAATRQALKSIADFLREELAGDGIRVLSLLLARSLTPLADAIARMDPGSQGYEARRLAAPEDIATVVVNALDVPLTAEIAELRLRPRQPVSTSGRVG